MAKPRTRAVLRQLRRHQLGLTQVELGRLVGCSGGMVAQIERGERPGSAAMRSAILKVIATEIGWERAVFGDSLDTRKDHRAT